MSATATGSADRYAERTGASLANLDWYTALAQWKVAVLYEYGRRRAFAAGGIPTTMTRRSSPDRSVGFLPVENRAGGRLLLEGAVMHTDGRLDPVVDVRHDLTFDQLDLRSGTVEVTTGAGQVYTIETDASGRSALMAGGGYGGRHGKALGRDHLESDVYPLDGTITQLTLESSLTDRLAMFDWDGTAGIGIFEFALTRSRSYSYRPTLAG